MSIWRILVRRTTSSLNIQGVSFKNNRHFTNIPFSCGDTIADTMMKNDEEDPIVPISNDGRNSNSDSEKNSSFNNKRKERHSNDKSGKKAKEESLDASRGRMMQEPPNVKNTIPNDGSYASTAMQEQFNINFPEQPLMDSKVSKKKVAILMAYVGSKFAGFQINKGQRTIQAELEVAIYRAGLLQKSNFGFPHKYGWSVSGRTDKGVHACAQVCSAKLEVGDMSEDEIRERINQHLHPDIVVLDVKRTLKSFCAKTHRSRVRYQYMIPSYLFYPDAKKMFAEVAIGERQHGAAPLTAEEIQTVRERIKDYRISPQQLATLKSALARYVGTHAYHNFTKGMNVGDSSAKRFIIDFKADDPVVREDGTEWIATEILGQSFLLNQIRKMIALACDVVCERASMSTMDQALDSRSRMILPIAPAQGLFLDMSIYDFYNMRKGQSPADAEDLDWVNNPDSPAMHRWKAFKDGMVLKTVFDEEERAGNFVVYLFMQTNLFEWEENYQLG